MSRDVPAGSFEDDDFPFPKVRYVLDMLVSWMVFFYFCFCGKRCVLIYLCIGFFRMSQKTKIVQCSSVFSYSVETSSTLNFQQK